MTDPLLAKRFKADWANGLWDLHKTQSRVHQMAASLQQVQQADDQQQVEQGGPVNAQAADPDGVNVDSNNPVTHTHNYPPPTVIVPPAPPQPKSNALPVALVIAAAIAAGAWLLSRPAAPQPVVPASPAAPTTPAPAKEGLEWSVGFFDP